MCKSILVKTINEVQLELNLEPPYNFKPKIKDILEGYSFNEGVKVLNRRVGKDSLILTTLDGVYGVEPQQILKSLEDAGIDIMEYPCDVLIAMHIIDKELLLGVIIKGIGWLRHDYRNDADFSFASLIRKERSNCDNRIEFGTSKDARDIIKEGLIGLYVSKVNALKHELTNSNLFMYLGVEIWYKSFKIKKTTDYTYVKLLFILDDDGKETYEITLDVYKTGEYKFKRKDC